MAQSVACVTACVILRCDVINWQAVIGHSGSSLLSWWGAVYKNWRVTSPLNKWFGVTTTADGTRVLALKVKPRRGKVDGWSLRLERKVVQAL